MKIRVDHEADALYIPLNEGVIVESELVAPGVVLDLDADGEVVGIEVLYLSRRSGLDLSHLLYEVSPTAPPRAVRDDKPEG